MNKRNAFITFLLMTVFAVNVAGQVSDPFSFIERYNQRVDSIRNYAASFTVRTDIPLLELPVVKGKMFYKWPAHYSVSTYDFTVLPRRKLAPIVRFLVREDFKALAQGTEKVNGKNCLVVRLTPVDTLSVVQNYTVWVDTTETLVYRVLLAGKDKSRFIYHYTYSGNDILPTGLTYTFEYRKQQPQKISMNPFALYGNYEPARLIEGKITLDFHYTEIRREGDKAE